MPSERATRVRTSSWARFPASSSMICSANPSTFFSTVSSISTSSSFARFLSVRVSGSKFLFLMRGSAFSTLLLLGGRIDPTCLTYSLILNHFSCPTLSQSEETSLASFCVVCQGHCDVWTAEVGATTSRHSGEWVLKSRVHSADHPVVLVETRRRRELKAVCG